MIDNQRLELPFLGYYKQPLIAQVELAEFENTMPFLVGFTV